MDEPVEFTEYTLAYGSWANISKPMMKWQGLLQVGDVWHTVASYERITTLALCGFDVIDHRQQDLKAVDFELVRKRFTKRHHATRSVSGH